MSFFNGANLIAILGALIVLMIYGFFIVYYRLHKGGANFDWKKRLSRIVAASPEEKEAALSLLKEDAVQDTFFKSKLQKIEGPQQWLQHAGLNFNLTLFFLICIFLGLIITLVFLIIFKLNALISFLFGTASSILLPWLVLVFLSSRRRNQFLDEFPIALDIMRRALRAGYSSDRAIEMVAEQQSGLIAAVFRTISDKMRLGEPVEAVLAEMSNRIGIDEFRMLSIVLVLQRETGGSLAEATENFSEIIRARQNLRKKVKALSAEVRVTAAILAALPFFILGSVYLSSPKYLDPLFYTETGHYLLIIGGVMLSLGIGIMVRMTTKEIY